ncbi:hypothetical protein BT102_03575 [Lacticaseibacillus rhamnosus]|nr:hypothetical protein BT102_03575 [Lacticaseibacillus rhamnosus]
MVLKADFFDYYHYKTELTALCREYHLAASGTKAELNQRLRAVMLGELLRPQRELAGRQPRLILV